MARAAEGVKWCRNKLRLSQKGLADKLGVSDVTVSYWENLKTDPTHENLERLCDLAKISLDHFWRIAKRSA